MFSVISQDKTILRDRGGVTVYRRSYLCDTEADVPALPTSDAPGSVALVADGGVLYILDHQKAWRRAGGAGGRIWSI